MRKSFIQSIRQKLMRPKGSRPSPEKAVDRHASTTHAPKPTQPTRQSRRQAHRHTHPPKPAWSIEQFQVEPCEGKTRFHDFELTDNVMRAVADLGFEYCTPIQADALPEALKGKDVAGQAQTGTGKTAAFLIATIMHMLKNRLAERPANGTPRALVICPTRELALQVHNDAEALMKYTPFKSLAVYGGMDYQRQKDALNNKRIDIVIATPGRLLDFRRNRDINLRHVEILIIDEADRMLDMGFIPDVRTIIAALPPKGKRQTMLWSATLSSDVMRLASQWTTDSVRVEVEPEQVAVDTVENVVYTVAAKEKFTLLYNFLQKYSDRRTLVFGNRRYLTSDLVDKLIILGIKCEALSGNVPQKKRLDILEKFRSGKIQVIIATDVASRGIHVDDIEFVINYDIPYEPEEFVHRIGRTGRAGATGTAISMACEEESFTIPEIEEYIGKSLPCEQPPEDLLTPLPDLPALRRPSRPREPRRDNRRNGSPRGGRGAGPRRSGHGSGSGNSPRRRPASR